MGFFVSIKAKVSHARLLYFLVLSMFALLDGRPFGRPLNAGREEQSSHEAGRRDNDDERRENVQHEHEEEEREQGDVRNDLRS